MKQNTKVKNYAVFCFAGKKKLLFYIYAVIVKQKIKKRSSNYCCGLVAFALYAALHRMRCNAMRCTGCDARADALRPGCYAMRCTVRGLFAIQCAARGLVAFAWCRRRHAFDGGIFRVVFFWDRFNIGNGTDSKNLFIGQYDKFFEEFWLSPIL
jgi:hypothetical protein